MEELFKTAWRNGVLPVARALADELKRSLLPDFGNAAGLEVCWDTDDVLALQEDEDKQVERWNKRWGAAASPCSNIARASASTPTTATRSTCGRST
jgi:hypothetical protein